METFEQTEAALSDVVAIINEQKALDAKLQGLLKNLKSLAGTSTLQKDGKFYQVRERNGGFHLCTFNKRPGRPKGVSNKTTKGLNATERGEAVIDMGAFATP